MGLLGRFFMSTSQYLHATEPSETPAHQQNARPNRLLVVEDNPVSLRLLKQLLKAHGYEVLGTPEGLQALDLAREEQPDLPITLGNLLRTIEAFLKIRP